MKAIETANLTDLYSYMTGVSRGGVTGYDISIRGFKTTQSDQNAILVDGLPGLAGRFGSPPTIMADHIEVVKGPASVLYGEAQPGGFVNIVTKKPRVTASGFIDVITSGFAADGLSPGNTNTITGDLDITGPIDADHRFLYRLVGEQSKVDTFRGGWERATYLAPSLTWNISSTTVATVSAEYRKRSNAYDNVLVAPNKDAKLIAPVTTKYQEPGDVQFEEGQSTTVSVSHDFGNHAIWKFSVRNVRGLDNRQWLRQRCGPPRPSDAATTRPPTGQSPRLRLFRYELQCSFPYVVHRAQISRRPRRRYQHHRFQSHPVLQRRDRWPTRSAGAEVIEYQHLRSDLRCLAAT